MAAFFLRFGQPCRYLHVRSEIRFNEVVRIHAKLGDGPSRFMRHRIDRPDRWSVDAATDTLRLSMSMRYVVLTNDSNAVLSMTAMRSRMACELVNQRLLFEPRLTSAFLASPFGVHVRMAQHLCGQISGNQDRLAFGERNPRTISAINVGFALADVLNGYFFHVRGPFVSKRSRMNGTPFVSLQVAIRSADQHTLDQQVKNTHRSVSRASVGQDHIGVLGQRNGATPVLTERVRPNALAARPAKKK